MAITFDGLRVGQSCSRHELARRWGYKDWHALGRGVVTPRGQNVVILFVTKEKAAHQVQYDDDFDGKILRMDGEANHANDERLAKSVAAGDRIHLFYRLRHHQRFTYCGEVALVTHQLSLNGRPSRFAFEVEERSAPSQ